MLEAPAIASSPLLEREPELRLIEDLLDAASRGRGGVLVVEGPAGIGKTRLVDRGVEIAAADEVLAMTARGGELERDLAYGVVRQLFAPALEAMDTATREELLAGPAALAARALAPGRAPDVDSAPVREALTELAIGLSRRRPLLMAIDDVQWADDASLLWLLHLVRRVDRHRIASLAARRTDGRGRSPVLDRIGAEPAVERAALAPLSKAAVEQLTAQALGDTTAATVCHELTGGNPFLVGELLDAARRRLRSHPDEEPDLAALAPSGVVLSVRRRIEGLPATALPLLHAAAVLERAGTIDEPARLAGLDQEESAAVVDSLVAAGILVEGPPLEFAHPLIRQAVYDDIPPGRRAVQHERAALLLSERGEVEEAAAHLLRSRRAPEAWAVGVLERAAAIAVSRGAPHVAIRHLRCALGGPDLGARRAALLGELGLAELRILDPIGFDHSRQAIAAASDVREAARFAVPTGRALTALWRHREAVELLTSVVSRLPAGGDSLRRALEGELIATACADTETLAQAREWLTEALRREGSSAALDPVPWGVHAMSLGAAGQAREKSIAIARLAIDGGRLGDAFASGLPYPSIALVWAGDVHPAEAAWQAALDRAQRTGSALESALAKGYLAICANARGHVARGESIARSALDAVLDAGLPAGPYPLSPLADALVGRGAAKEAISLIDEHHDRRTVTSVSFPALLFSRGRARIAAGDSGGLDDVLEAGRRFVAQGAPNPAIAPWRSVAAQALAARGEGRRAEELVEEELALARAYGAPGPVGVALTAAANIRAPAHGVDLAAEAVRTLDRGVALGALAKALACEGRLLAATGRRVEARVPLRRAFDLTHRLGALALAHEVKRDLIATGARPRRAALSGPAALTPREEAVARLAAAGCSSRQIADRLVISIRTVDLHLSRAYGKLGVHGRAQLREAFDGQKAAPTAPKDW